MSEKEKESQTELMETEIVQTDGDRNEKQETSTGLEENVAGLLCYVVGFISGIVFIFIEKENQFIRFHAFQSTITFGVLFLANFILAAIPIIGWILALLLTPLTIVVWIILMMKAYKGERFKLPIVGNIVESQLQQK